MTLSSEHQAKLIVDTTERIVREYILPAVLLEIDSNMRKHIFDGLSFIYRDEIIKQVQKVIKADLLDQFDIDVSVRLKND